MFALLLVQAAAHIHRYLTLDENILLETTADSSTGKSIVNATVDVYGWEVITSVCKYVYFVVFSLHGGYPLPVGIYM